MSTLHGRIRWLRFGQVCRKKGGGYACVLIPVFPVYFPKQQRGVFAGGQQIAPIR